MLRNVLALVGGVVICGVVITLVQMLSHWMYPFPAGMDPSDPKAIEAMLPHLPLGALLMVELSYLLGSGCGGWVVGRFARSRQDWLAVGLGAVFTLANVANLVQIPHPLWLAVLTTVTFIPVALLASRLARRGAPAPAT
jgi:hypothetical protein